ncbi:hypothetical protein MMC07_006817 [Pseudocyphellaria aurata]|nr:hypothetical protein [Pseudocyphellaria aurata]
MSWTHSHQLPKPLKECAEDTIAAKQLEIDRLMADQMDAQADHQKLQQELLAAQHKGRKAASALERANEQLADTQAQLQASCSRVHGLEERMKASEADALKARADFLQAEQRLAAMQHELAAVQAVLHSNVADADVHQAEQAGLLAELETVRKELAAQELIAADSMLMARRLQEQLRSHANFYLADAMFAIRQTCMHGKLQDLDA